MSTLFRSVVRALAMGLICAGGVASAFAQGYPSRAITVIQPFPPGGASDALARIVADRFVRDTGQQMIIDSRPGAGGNTAALAVLNARRDGYTVFLSHMGIQSINPFLFRSMPFDPIKDFKAVVSLAEVKGALVVPTNSPAKAMGDLIGLSKNNPKGMSYASSGIGTGSHLVAEIFASGRGAKFVHIPYQTSARALTDLMEGRVDFMFTALAPILPHIRSGKLRPLSVIVPQRINELLPDVPTTAELGFPDVTSATWYGIFVPTGTPGEEIPRLNRIFNDILKESQVVASLLAAGLWVTGGTPQDLDRRIADERQRYQRVIREIGIPPQ